VTIDQSGCIYSPRVVGARVGQTLQVRNSDRFLHNVHSLSAHTNSFNIGQPIAGMVLQFRLKDEEIMLPLKCDLHRWMTSYVGVVSHPHFAVSSTRGTFEIANVPAGTYTLQTWHERYGKLTQPVRVRASATTTVNFAYTGAEHP
jgi:plastocyanin